MCMGGAVAVGELSVHGFLVFACVLFNARLEKVLPLASPRLKY